MACLDLPETEDPSSLVMHTNNLRISSVASVSPGRWDSRSAEAEDNFDEVGGEAGEMYGSYLRMQREFNPNDSRYRCCCSQSHSIVGVRCFCSRAKEYVQIGVRIIAGMLCVTVVLEAWHLVWSYGTSGPGFTKDDSLSSIFQLAIGLVITLSVLYSLRRESPVFLLPYLFLQTIGLAAVFVVLLALIYITLANDVSTIRSLMETHSPYRLNAQNEKYLAYFGWTMIGSCFLLLALQLWLMSIVFACWCYFRDKRSSGYAKGYISSLVVFRPSPTSRKASEKNAPNLMNPSTLRSISADELLIQRSLSEIAIHRPIKATLSSISYDYA